ncbi:unnamed protein product [Pedinophyceae sp. YPF-701]|nr:unnamed protein product [Pedinophyceae sp. YPF-701]
MSTRQIRKLQEELERKRMEEAAAAAEGNAESSDDDAGDSDSEPQGKGPVNLFALLGDDGEVASEDGASDDQAPASSTKKSKKKKKRGKTAKPDPKEAASTSSEDIDQLIAELNIRPAAEATQPASDAAAPTEPLLLAADPKHLRPEAELRRRFGSAALADDDDQPQAHWPPGGGSGLSMEEIAAPEGRASPPGTRWFRFVRSEGYNVMEEMFSDMVQTFDPNNIMMNLQHHPYHVASLLALHDVCRQTGDAEGASDFLARALYAMESAFHPRCDACSATARLPASEPTNADWHRAGFLHVQALTRSGCHRTALEACKLLLSLEPSDPTGLLHGCVDYLAIRAGEGRFLVELASGKALEDVPGVPSVGLLPNFAYSVALAKRNDAVRSGGDGQGGADDALLGALALHPAVLPALMSALAGKGVHQDAEWKSILAHEFFSGADHGGCRSLEYLSDIFVERSHPLWRADQVLRWLKRGARRLTELADAGGSVSGISVAEWATVRAQAFPPSDTNNFVHLDVADFSEAQQILPPDEDPGGGVPGGVDDGFAAAAENLPPGVAEAMAQDAGVDVQELREMGGLAAFLRTLLPWVNPQNNDGGAQQERGAEEGGPRE